MLEKSAMCFLVSRFMRAGFIWTPADDSGKRVKPEWHSVSRRCGHPTTLENFFAGDKFDALVVPVGFRRMGCVARH